MGLAAVNQMTHVLYNDAGPSVLLPNGTFTWTLPCLPIEVKEGRCKSTEEEITVRYYSIQRASDADVPRQVRAVDGVHFCPKIAKNGLDCEVYCSGCRRFGMAMAQSVLQHLKRSEHANVIAA